MLRAFGKLKAIGVTSPERSPLVPELPTIRDADVRGADLEIWTALARPRHEQAPRWRGLNAALVEVISTDEVREALLKTGWQAQPCFARPQLAQPRAPTRAAGRRDPDEGIHAEG